MSTTICTDPGVSYRNHLDTCIYVWEPMENTAHGYVISRGSSWLLTWRKQRKRSVITKIVEISIIKSFNFLLHISTAAGDIHNYFFHYFSDKIRPGVSSESCAEDSHKNQALFSSKDKSKKLKCRLLQFLFGALRFKSIKE